MHETPGLDGTEFDNRLRSLQKLLKETWKKIEYAFRIDTEHEIKKMETDLKKIKEGPFEDLRVYLKELQDSMDNEGVASMKEIYKSYLSEAPDVYLLEEGPGTRQHTKILEIFTEMQIIYDGGVDKIDFRDWLTAIENERDKNSKQSKFLLVEGVAGVGKTTLSRKIVLDWSDGNDTMDHLLDNQSTGGSPTTSCALPCCGNFPQRGSTATELFEATLDEIKKKLNNRQPGRDIPRSREVDGSSSSHIEDLIRSSQNVFTHLLTKCNGTFCKLIAPQIVQGDNFIGIDEARVQAYNSILPHCTDIASISLRIEKDPKDILCLEELLQLLAEKQWELTLYLMDENKHPKLHGSCLEQEIQQFSNCKLDTIQGQLSYSSLESLPQCLTELGTSVATEDQYNAIRPFLAELDIRLPCLKTFREYL
ncbi:hypothetical protein C7M84_018061 [Penaeus vannamei]|uniref:NACHT domain-containing protein n=1 Tax=Penaeus vannamei TaxID=6689 RepID=A0A3R7M0J8_PENVA|nr:hypothetical protein C7M84_018061 [Penaeus vannamei]